MGHDHPIMIDEWFGVTEADRPRVPPEMLRECRLKRARETIRSAVYFLSGGGRIGSGAWITSDEQARSHAKWILLDDSLFAECESIARLPTNKQPEAIERLAVTVPDLLEKK